MKLKTRSGQEILTFDDWASIYETPQQSRQWKEHRSAYSVADFILNREGTEKLRKRTSEALRTEVTFDHAIPELEIRFDSFGRGRVHDLAIYGNTTDGKSLFVGVEAKVDEPFGAMVRDVYLQAKADQITGQSTNAPQRIEQLLAKHFSAPDMSIFDVRYQLLYATTGTLVAEADIHILFVVVFKTPLYNEVIGAENYRDYIEFVSKVGAQTLDHLSKDVLGHRMEIDGKELISLYEYFHL